MQGETLEPTFEARGALPPLEYEELSQGERRLLNRVAEWDRMSESTGRNIFAKICRGAIFDSSPENKGRAEMIQFFSFLAFAPVVLNILRDNGIMESVGIDINNLTMSNRNAVITLGLGLLSLSVFTALYFCKKSEINEDRDYILNKENINFKVETELRDIYSKIHTGDVITVEDIEFISMSFTLDFLDKKDIPLAMKKIYDRKDIDRSVKDLLGDRFPKEAKAMSDYNYLKDKGRADEDMKGRYRSFLKGEITPEEMIKSIGDKKTCLQKLRNTR